MADQTVPPVLSYRALNPRPTSNPRRVLIIEDNLDSVVTAYDGVDHRSRSKAAGFELHLVKPIAPQGLFDLLESSPGTDPAAGRSPTGG